MAYFEDRILGEYALAPEDIKIKIKIEGRHATEEGEISVFESDKDGNIKINFVDLDRWRIEYDNPKADLFHANSANEKKLNYYITRLAPENVNGDAKYLFPSGAGCYPFLPPEIIEAYEAKAEIKTLYLTEGAFKAFYASRFGLPIVGLTSISHYADKRTNAIHKDIARIIKTCGVKNVVMLYDGDCFNISTKALERGEDLAKRPNGFLNSMLRIKDLLEDFNVSVWFAHINSAEAPNKAKGLDDVLVAMRGREQSVVDDCLTLSHPTSLVPKLNVSSFPKKLQGKFNLRSVTEFYGVWSDVIRERPFVFFGTSYQLNEKGEIIKLVPRELKNYMRVGDDYYELIEKPNIFEPSETETIMYPRAKGTISDDYGKDAFKHIDKYKAFINFPSNTNYQRVINNCYNLYNPIKHEPRVGAFPYTQQFLLHYFGEQIDLGLDYLTIIYKYPTETLPILCLVSAERGTGKSTFCNWLRDIYGNNVAYIGNTEFESQFNGAFTSKLICAIDETSLDNKRTTEKLKMLSTAKKINSQRKGKDFEEVDNFTKYILCSNNETNFIYTDENEVRFWVRKLKPLENDNPELLKYLHNEIPHFLQYLQERKIVHPKQTRAWFAFDLLKTDALKQMFEAQKPQAQKIIEKYVTEIFEDFDIKDEFIINETQLIDRLPALRKHESKLRDIILLRMRADITRDKNGKPSPRRYAIPYFNDITGEIAWHRYCCRAFVFKRADFIKD